MQDCTAAAALKQMRMATAAARSMGPAGWIVARTTPPCERVPQTESSGSEGLTQRAPRPPCASHRVTRVSEARGLCLALALLD